MEKKKMSRRDFLKVASMTAGGIVLAACAPKATNTSEKTPTESAPLPTQPQLTKQVIEAQATYTPLNNEQIYIVPGVTIEPKEPSIYSVSEDRKKFLVSLPEKNITYFVNIDNNNEVTTIDQSGDQVFLKNDGTQIYFHKNTGNEDTIYDLQKKESVKILWPDYKQLMNPICISNDFKVIARHVKMDQEKRTINCEFGLLYLFQENSGDYTSYIIHSSQRIIVPEEIWLENKVYYLKTSLGDVFSCELNSNNDPKINLFRLVKFGEFTPPESTVNIFWGNNEKPYQTIPKK